MEGKQLEIVVLYADLVGSTKTVGKLSPKKIPRYYTIFLNEMTNVINDFGGRILKYVGDCIIGFFALPSRGWISTVDQATLCALTMKDIMEFSISPVAKSENLPQMSCRIGTDFGEVQVVKIGVEGIYLTVDILGDVMNIASKICAKAEAGEILLGANLWKLLYTSHKMMCTKTKTLELNGSPYDLYSLSYDFHRT